MTDKCVKDVGLEDLEPWPDEVRCHTKSGTRSYVPKGEAEFTWHKMAEEQPADDDASYVVTGKRGAMYLAGSIYGWGRTAAGDSISRTTGAASWTDKVRVWAEIPPFEEARP